MDPNFYFELNYKWIRLFILILTRAFISGLTSVINTRVYISRLILRHYSRSNTPVYILRLSPPDISRHLLPRLYECMYMRRLNAVY